MELAEFYIQQIMAWAIMGRDTNDEIVRLAAHEYVAFYTWILESVN